MDVRRVERIVKGFSNHHRIRILSLLEKEPGLPLNEIAEELKLNFRTVSEHTKKLVASGLILKKYKGSIVQHQMTELGKDILRFCKKL